MELGAPPPAPGSRDTWPGTRPLVWAPRARTVDVVLPRPGDDERRPMRLVGAHEPGYWRADEELPPGTDYLFSVDGGAPVPDPCSPLLPSGLGGPTRVLDPAFAWTDHGWAGRALAQAVLLHVDVATFTPAGTLDAAAERLVAVAASGVAGVELSPVAAFDAVRGPASGVRLFAVHEPYGGPRALQRFVDAAHAAGLAVVLDLPHRWAVADDLGLHAFGPYAVGSRIGPRTGARPGPAGTDSPRLNLDGSGSRGPRDFLVADAERWLRDFHVDGLLLDVEALVDRSPVPFLGELAERVHALGERLGRPLTLLTDGPGRSDRLTSVVHGILAAPGDDDRAQDLRRLAQHVFGANDAQPWRPPSLRRARRATQRAASVLVGDLTRLPAAARAVPWSPSGCGPATSARSEDERACLLTFALLAGTPPVLDTEHVPVGQDDAASRRLVAWARTLIGLRPEVTAEVDAPVEVHSDGEVMLGRRGSAAVALATGHADAVVDVERLLATDRGPWQVAAAWDPDQARLDGGRLALAARSPVVLRAAGRA
ncbi:hypothetical protein GCM10009809_31170 [Isoptericola hypogeus]|uniref:Glycosyl hydrolase family 13 catalytic domain-containing protein n=1 Tax=Isoptericola hypogeus TaxID=300179 RepID=A0ABN2JNK3_9MICO